MTRTRTLPDSSYVRSSVRRGLFWGLPMILTAVFGCFPVVQAHAITQSVPQRCSTAKLKAVTKALVCVARQENRAILGGLADVARCTSKLGTDFAKAEAKAGGACPTNGDVGSAQALVTATEAGMLSAVMAGAAGTSREKTCAAKKNKAGAAFADCIGTAVARRLKLYPYLRDTKSDFAKCETKVGELVAREDALGGCLTTGDAAVITDLTNPVGGYLPGATFFPVAPNETASLPALWSALLVGANLQGATLVSAGLGNANLNNANLAGATLVGARARGASFDGANLTGTNLTGIDVSGPYVSLAGVIWSGTTCGDGTNSGTNGTSPESCCGHFAVEPATCSP